MADERRRHSFAEIAGALYPNLTPEVRAGRAQQQSQQKWREQSRERDRQSLLRHLREAKPPGRRER
jgi:hypothetical protein